MGQVAQKVAPHGNVALLEFVEPVGGQGAFVELGQFLDVFRSRATLDGKLSDTVTVTADSTLFPGPGTATAFVCLDSNDAATPVLAVKVEATQN